MFHTTVDPGLKAELEGGFGTRFRFLFGKPKGQERRALSETSDTVKSAIGQIIPQQVQPFDLISSVLCIWYDMLHFVRVVCPASSTTAIQSAGLLERLNPEA